MDLRSRLEQFKKGEILTAPKQRISGADIHDLVSGQDLETDCGHCFLIEKSFPLEHVHGGMCLHKAFCLDFTRLKTFFPELGRNNSIKDFLFLDTETTGLSGGAGTVAFLVGTGFFTEDSFVIRQYFMRDYDEEPALLKLLNQLWGDFKGLITFNGKAFDHNLLTSRYTFNRIRPALKEPLHLDLLYPSRRLWKLKLESCRLSSIEESILGEYRVGDIPGALIPSIYFKYLEDRNAGEILKVIKHNEDDIISMVSLLCKLEVKLGDPLVEADGLELYGLGRIFERERDYDRVIECLEHCLKSEAPGIKHSAAQRLTDIYKRKGDYGKAVEHWYKMLEEDGGLRLFPLIELAKYYEHREKDHNKAIELVERAMSICLKTGLSRTPEISELKKRYDRLKKKAGRGSNGK